MSSLVFALFYVFIAIGFAVRLTHGLVATGVRPDGIDGFDRGLIFFAALVWPVSLTIWLLVGAAYAIQPDAPDAEPLPNIPNAKEVSHG